MGSAVQAGGREVKGLMEALQVTAPRASSSARLVLGDAQPYPSAAAKACLTASHASQCIWAAAVLGGSAMYEPETDGLIQVSCFMNSNTIALENSCFSCEGFAAAYNSTVNVCGMAHHCTLPSV